MRLIAGAVRPTIAFACLLAVLPAARAQDAAVAAPASSVSADAPLTPDETAALARALTFDPEAGGGAARQLRLPALPKPAGLAVSRNDNADGSGTVAVKQPLPLDFDSAPLNADVGADVALAAPPPTTFQPGRPLPGSAPDDAGSSAAWGSLGMADLASLDARADPTHEQGTLAGTLKHSIPVGKEFSLTLAGRYSVTQTLGASAAPTASAAPATPPAAIAAPQAQVWDSAKSVKFDVRATGTSFGAGFTTASNDPVTHNTLSADQKLLGPLHVTTAVNDLGEASESKSITAGFKLNW